LISIRKKKKGNQGEGGPWGIENTTFISWLTKGASKQAHKEGTKMQGREKEEGKPSVFIALPEALRENLLMGSKKK